MFLPEISVNSEFIPRGEFMYRSNPSGRLKRALKLFFCFFTPVIAVLALGFHISIQSLEKEVENQTIEESRIYNQVFKADFINYMGTLKNEVTALGNNPLIKKLTVDLAAIYKNLGSDSAAILTKKYGRNSAPIAPAMGEPAPGAAAEPEAPPAAASTAAAPAAPVAPAPEQPAAATDSGSALYDSLHAAYNPIFSELAKSLNIYDILLIDAEGHVIYSKEKYSDFTADLNDDKWKDSTLAKIFREAKELKENNVVLHDVKPYEAAHGAPSALMAAPVKDNDNLVGVVVFRLGFTPHPTTFDFPALLKNDENIFIAAKDGSVAYSIANNPFRKELLDIASMGSFTVEVAPGERRTVSMQELEFLGNKWELVSELNLNYRLNAIAAPLETELQYKYLMIAGIMGIIFLGLAFLLTRKRPEPFPEIRPEGV